MFGRRGFGLFVVLIAISGLLLGGCGHDASRPGSDNPPENENPNLEDPTGGLTSSDELPAFGDEVLAGSGDIEAAIEDEISNDPVMIGWSRSDSVHAYVVTLLWGQLDSDPSIRPEDGPSQDAIDWSGSMSVNAGGIRVASTIAFERGDYLVGPRMDRERLMWVSHTTTSFDGLRVYVLQPFNNGGAGETDSLVIDLGAHKYVYLMNDLQDLDFTETTDDLGNQVRIRSFLAQPEVCGRGFVGGAWILPAKPDSLGSFHGRWVSADGSVAGYMRGHLGVNEAGRRVFFGKYIDLDGNFLGFLRGTWDNFGADSPAHGNRIRNHGRFNGDLLDADRNRIGAIRGGWRSFVGVEEGFYEGVWSRGCPN